MSPFTRLFVYAVVIADLFALIIFGGRFFLTGSLLSHNEPAPILVAGAEDASSTNTAEAAPEVVFDLASYVPNAEKGAKIAGKCKACHTFEKEGPNRTGPNQWGIVGSHFGHADGFSYSSALLAQKAEGKVWNEENLHAFLENPKEYIPGTKMQFNGVRNPADRADLIAWLKTLK